ncbi:GrpB family protein [Clostridium saccharoperbutylacetonicum]|uniref:GrpB family protein n=1 Tax=Clostridium saccharoperbutylacetonicum TaxID=36745 RepID=UPI0039ED47A9
MKLVNNINLKIIGEQKILDKGQAANDIATTFIFSFFRRIKEINYSGNIARLIMYEALLPNNNILRFVGIEVEDISMIPKNMVAWELTDNCWKVLMQDDGINKIISQYDINWRWISQVNNNSFIRNIGEFYIKNGSNSVLESNDYCIVVNAYYDFSMKMENGDRVEIVEYDSSWPEQYKNFANWLFSAIGRDIALRIEHIGSTAIPGMPSKPSIDVAIEVPSFFEARKRMLPLLNDATWEYWGIGSDVIFYKRNRFMGRRTHYIHIAPSNHDLWKRIAFRDFLRQNPEYAMKYANLKRKLVISSGGEWLKYTMAKGDFVKKALEHLR